jgi:hypothetical protein
MKKLFVIAAVTIASASAFASKARQAALQGAAHLSDITDVVGYASGAIKPDQALNYGDTLAIEFGTASGNPNAEGGFVRKHGEDMAYGAFFGHKSATMSYFRTLSNSGTTYLNQQNPLNLFYAAKAGDLQWGAGLQYVNSENKVAKQKEALTALHLSASSAMGWDAQLAMGLTATAENATTVGAERKLEGKSNMALAGGYKMDSLYLYGSYKMASAKDTIASSTNALGDWERTDMSLGVVNSNKKDGADFFYGVAYTSTAVKNKLSTGEAKNDQTALPVIVGLEADAASWLVLRGSLTQNVLIGTEKQTTAGSTTATTDTIMADSTTAAAGAGIKFGKFTIDGTLRAGTTGLVGSDTNFLTNASMTYMF